MARYHTAPADRPKTNEGGLIRGTLEAKLPLKKLVETPNIAEELAEKDLGIIGQMVVDNFNKDKGTRAVWEQRSAEAIKLALQIAESKSFPWPNCSNVKFPLLTIAALQFLARVSVLTKGRNLAKVEVIGADLDGKKADRAKRISTHLSLQLSEYDVNWVDSDEQAKLSASILGSAFKKTYHDSITGDNISEHVPAMNLVLDYHCKDISKASRITHLITMTGNEIEEKVRRGLFCPMLPEGELGSITASVNQLKQVSDQVSGMSDPQDGSAFEILEQHNWLDLDGDGYAEPYIMSVRADTSQVLRIVARFLNEGDVHRQRDQELRALKEELESQPKEEAARDVRVESRLEKAIAAIEADPKNLIVRIEPLQYFTRMLFIPSPDGGVYGLGFGALLGPMNASVDTLINQLLDGGTMSTLAGGFLARGVKMKGGSSSFSPFEWKPVDSSGDDLRKSLFPLPVREPSAVLFSLLGMLVQYGEKISGATDIMTGVSPGQNTPAETSRNTVEQGMMLFSGIYSRMYRAFREELKKEYHLNKLYFKSSPRFYDLAKGPEAIVAPDDYDSNSHRVLPAASPEAVSSTQRKDKADKLVAFASQRPGLDQSMVTRQWLEAHEYEDLDRLYPDPKGPNAIQPPQNPKVELEKAKFQQSAKEHEDEMKLAIVSLQSELSVNEAKVQELEAKAALHLSEADGVSTGHQIALIDAALGAARAKQEGLHKALELMQKAEESHRKHPEGGLPTAGGVQTKPAQVQGKQ